MQFSRNQRMLVNRAMTEAETCTARYYCIPPHRFENIPYDLLTREDEGWDPLPEAVLAQTRKLNGVTARRTPYEFFRIQLNDPSILSAASRENLGDHLYPFFVYILTHEMVHLVRLSTILEDKTVPECPEKEELRVQQISRQVLARTGSGSLAPVFDRFCALHPHHPRLTPHAQVEARHTAR